MSRVRQGTIWNSTLGAEQRYRDVGGIRTRTLEAGDSGDTLLLLHGTGGHVETYTHNVLELAKDFRVVAVDMLGHGLTDKPDVEYVVPDYTAHIRDLLDELGVERAHVLGESLGGWIAEYFAWEYPERVLKVVNCTGGVFRWPEGESPLEAEQRRNMVGKSQALRELTVENVTKRLELLFHDPSMVTEELVQTRYWIYSQPRMREVVVKLHHMLPYESEDRARYSLTPELLASLTRPVLYLWGEFNPGSSVESAQRASELTPNSRVHVINDVGHWPQWENPEEFNSVVRQFLLEENE